MAKISKKMFKKALEGSLGTQRDLAAKLSVSDSAVFQYMERHPDMRVLFEKRRLMNVDTAENEIFHQLNFDAYEREPATAAKIRQNAAQFILKTLGRSKGWVEKQEIEHSGKIDNKMEVEVIYIQKKEDEDSDDNSLSKDGTGV